jgi:hypothetical protein
MKILLLIAIFLILILLFSKNTEKMTDVVPYYNKLDALPDFNTKCCLVEKNYVKSDNSLYGGNFEYNYSSKQNEDCDPSKYELNNNKQLLIDGVNNWSNDNCTNKNKVIGSCRMVNKECIDFVDKPFCDKIPDMVWSDKTCNNPIFLPNNVIIDNPEKDTSNETFVLFPEQEHKF